MTQARALRRRAEDQAARLPPLLAAADRLASAILLGEHGRRRAGMGDDFWQYRPVQPGDALRSIDWRRSARSDESFVRQREWQIAQSVMLWVDRSASMDFASTAALPTKAARARTLGLAAAILLLRGGERVGLPDAGLPPRRGEAQAARLAESLSQDDDADYGLPPRGGVIARSRALYVSDFLAEPAAFDRALGEAADRGVRGILLQVLDPAEEAFPYRGRTIFESGARSLVHETLKADALRERYLARLAERKAALASIAAATGWQYHCHHTDAPAQVALQWVYRAMQQKGGG